MHDQIRQLFAELDAELCKLASAEERLDLYPVGRGAIIWFHGLALGAGATKDLDVLQFGADPAPLLAAALQRFGEGTENAARLGLYLEAVVDGLPPVPIGFRRRCVERSEDWRVLRLWKLDDHDLAATKLKRFHARDRQDVQALCDRELLQAARLRASLEEAFIWTTDKEGDPDRDRAFSNLDRVISYLEGRTRSL